MKRTTKPTIVITIRGNDDAGRDCIVAISNINPMSLADAVRETMTAYPLTPPARADNARSARPAPKCPKCQSDCWDNRPPAPRKPNSPLVKCKKCSWRLWESPRTDQERADTALWSESK